MIRLSSPLLEVRGLRLDFNLFDGIAHVLDGVDFEVHSKEVVAIVGESGCGKTVTMGTILGTVPMPPAQIIAGTVKFEGKDLLKLNKRDLQRLRGSKFSVIPQSVMTSLNPTLTIGRHIADVLCFRNKEDVGLRELFRGSPYKSEEIKKQIITWLKNVQIPDPERIMCRYPFELSGGMRQRVLIALALCCKPLVLFADEPGTALDVTTYDEILRLIEEKTREATMIYISHNLAVAKRVSNVIYVMYAGSVVERGPSDTLFENPQHPYTKGLIGALPKLTKEPIRGIAESVPNYLSPPPGCRFHPRCKYAMQVCRQEKPKPTHIEPGHIASCHIFS